MEKLINSDIIIDIELIELISGANQEFEILFSTKDEEKHKIIFDFVWDMRYSIENASIDRFSQFQKHLPEEFIYNGIYVVENSEYIQYFQNQVSGTISVDKIMHYILCDKIDTIIDVLTTKEPILVRI